MYIWTRNLKITVVNRKTSENIVMHHISGQYSFQDDKWYGNVFWHKYNKIPLNVSHSAWINIMQNQYKKKKWLLFRLRSTFALLSLKGRSWVQIRSRPNQACSQDFGPRSIWDILDTIVRDLPSPCKLFTARLLTKYFISWWEESKVKIRAWEHPMGVRTRIIEIIDLTVRE